MIDLFFAFQDDHLFTQVLYIEIELKKKASHNEITEAIPDTKVVERGKGNGIFINTTGIGFVLPDVDVYVGNAQPGDSVIVSGTIGNHGIEVLSSR